MSPPLSYTKSPWQENYSEIIDVRSPGEFAEDHFPNAINLPVLSNEQRAEVGTIYQQVSPFQAKKIGAALVSENIAKHLKSHFTHKDKNYSPLVYCWRGGQRSRSFATVLSEIGWRVTVLEGGYKTYRTYVRSQLEQLPQQLTYKILCGLTGTGKTHILRAMVKRGVQVLDLEGLANHRGSLLGQEWQTFESETNFSSPNLIAHPLQQPSQKYFESALVEQLKKFDLSKVVWLESESNKIGQLHVPANLWCMMQQAKCVEIKVPQLARVDWLLQKYDHLAKSPTFLKDKLQQLKSHYGNSKIMQWLDFIDRGQFHTLVTDLLEQHYDPAYHRSMSKSYYPRLEKSVSIPDLSPQSIDSALQNLGF